MWRTGAGVQLAFWGCVLPGEALELTLGLPAASLAPLGLSNLPADFVFAIPIRGTSRQPRIDWIKCAPAAQRASHCHSSRGHEHAFGTLIRCEQLWLSTSWLHRWFRA